MKTINDLLNKIKELQIERKYLRDKQFIKFISIKK